MKVMYFPIKTFLAMKKKSTYNEIQYKNNFIVLEQLLMNNKRTYN